ncbi:hypothetical protein ACFTWF_35010 [Rhodococcus sp. NPDC056960]|uniref:hypothetical protein n=1 Tax=Rhodococcus sp. NPDC056960 TaxID=3345982 RepID=UPI003627E52E
MSELVTADDLSDLPRSAVATEAIQLLDSLAGVLVHVSTNNSLNPTKDDRQYKQKRLRMHRLLAALKVKDPIPYDDLGEWNGYWKMHLPKWAARKSHVRDLIAATKIDLENIRDSASLVVPTVAASAMWGSLDGRVAELGSELARSGSTDDLQDVGRRCREILIDAAKILARPELVPVGEDVPKAADAKKWLGYYVDRFAAGSTQKELRSFIRSAWDLAQRVTHGDIDRTETYAAAQATVLIVRVLQDLEARTR